MSTENEIAIKVTNVSKSFKLPHEKNSSIKSLVLHPFKKRTYEKQQVLNDINFEIKKGEFFGIVGRNGSGKSTLLKLLAGIYSPDKGHIQVNGKLTPFIELGVGFNPELTGRENVFLNGALLGFNRKEMLEMYDEIVEFAELEKFMDQKLKNYSSGMQVRLAFSIAIRAKSEILLIDEVLAVGDANFQRKCFEIFNEIKRIGRTVVFVTHDMGAVEQFCNRSLLIENGKIVYTGNSIEVSRKYRSTLLENEKPVKDSNSKKIREGNGFATITSYSVCDVKNTRLIKVKDENKELLIKIRVKFNEASSNPIFGITIYDPKGAPFFLTNTRAMHIKAGSISKGEELEITWKLPNVFNNGVYSVVPAVAGDDALTVYDSITEGCKIASTKDYYLPGPLHVDHNIYMERL